jgi:hypothetical protein
MFDGITCATAPAIGPPAIGRDAVLDRERLLSDARQRGVCKESGENGDANDRYTLGVGGRRRSTPTAVDDVFRHFSTSVIGRVDGVRPVSDTGSILTLNPA